MDKTEQVRELDRTELIEAAALYRTVFGSKPWNEDWSDENKLSAYIVDIAGAENSLNFGLFANGRIIAAALGSVRHWWQGSDYILEELFVYPELQGSGVGTRFMKMIEDDLRKRSIAGIYLQTDNDKPAYSFYIKNSYNEMKNRVSFFKKI
ncbi:MAG: GNAT family N-acetyltransferase [Ruminiclostridium sp.]|nr:GNAT family N-acetyltransferase [Ruminiclostridium sp.]